MEAKVYNQEGKETGKASIPTSLLEVPWNATLVHQAVVALQANRRHNTALARDRSGVAGGGRKPWRQKGTGRARHGSIRSPLWRGGGVTHGPTRERGYDQKINRQMKRRALFSVLAKKWQDKEVLLVNELKPAGKTKMAAGAFKQFAAIAGFEKLGYKTGQRALVVLPSSDPATARSFRNLPGVRVTTVNQLSPLNLLTYRFVVIVNPQASLPILVEGLAKI